MSETDERRTERTVDVMKELADTADKIVQPGLAKISELHHLRATRLTLAAQRLETGLGSSHPRVASLRSRAAAAEKMRDALDVERQRDSERPKPNAKEWMVHGRIVDASGTPLEGAKVRVYERTASQDHLISEVESNSFGDYAITYHERIFAGAPDSADLLIEVVDREGNILIPGDGELRFKPGRDEHLGIVIDTEARRPVPPPEPEPDRPEPPRPEPPSPGDDPIPLTDVQGIGRTYLGRLTGAGIEGVRALIRLDAQRLSTILDVSVRQASTILAEAKRVVKRRRREP